MIGITSRNAEKSFLDKYLRGTTASRKFSGAENDHDNDQSNYQFRETYTTHACSPIRNLPQKFGVYQRQL